MRRDYVNTAILWFILTFIAELLLPYADGIFPLAAAQEAQFSDESFRTLMVLGTPVFTFVVAVLLYSLFNFRARGDALEDGATIHGNAWVSGVWLLVTFALNITVVIHPGLTGLAKFQGNKNADVAVKVTGRQWAWDVAYPAYGVTGATELVLPVGKRTKFEITSTDILHSFWIPAFRDKIDAVPGRVTTMYITPNQTGTFTNDFNLRVQCAELCGTGHAAMAIPVRVVTPSEFEAWTKEKGVVSNDPVVRGAALAKSQGCAACHSVDGSVTVGPTWLNLYGHDVPLADGTTVKADEAYLRESISNPNAKIVKGFARDVMPPTFGKTLTEDQLNDLIAYIKSLAK
jgi:cytochrome c oxidase subunit 2